MSNLEYFEILAASRVKNRERHLYYWNDITKYLDFFSYKSNSVLEIGCGTGELINEIRGDFKTGVDFSSNMIQIASKNFPNIDFHVMNAENIELSFKYDLIILSNLVGYTEDVLAIFKSLPKVCHERTKVIVTYYSKFWEPLLKVAQRLGIKEISPEQNWLTMSDINNLFKLAGFEVYRESRRLLIPVYIPFFSHLLNSYVAKLPIFRSFCLNSFSFAKLNEAAHNERNHYQYSVSIIIPARNESGNILNALERMPNFGKFQEIIYVEGNSKDNTWEAINNVYFNNNQKFNLRIAKQEGFGKADAVRKGFELATGDILVILDADLTVPPEDLIKFYDAIISNKGDFINGSRLVYPMEKQAMRFLNMLANTIFGWIFSWLFDQKFKDTLCGTKVLFRREYNKIADNRKYFGDFDPFGDFDLLFGAFKLNHKIIEMPVKYKERAYGSTNISRFKHGLILLKMCWFAARKLKFI